jgi:hypothetical protein
LETEPVRQSASIPDSPPTPQAFGVSVTPIIAIVYESALVAYFKLLSIAAQACGTPESTALLPGITAPAALFNERRLLPCTDLF